jgi:type IV pilus assembly protein PilQ
MKTDRLALALSTLLVLQLATARAEATAAGAARPAASPTPTPTAIDTRPAPAEPSPVMPTTVVRPATAPRGTPRRVDVGSHGAIELGRPAPAESRWKGFPITLSLRDAPLDEVLRSFARLTGMNLVIQPGVQGTVTCELHDVPWDQALYVILKTQGLGAEVDGRVWTVERY